MEVAPPEWGWACCSLTGGNSGRSNTLVRGKAGSCGVNWFLIFIGGGAGADFAGLSSLRGLPVWFRADRPWYSAIGIGGTAALGKSFMERFRIPAGILRRLPERVATTDLKWGTKGQVKHRYTRPTAMIRWGGKLAAIATSSKTRRNFASRRPRSDS